MTLQDLGLENLNFNFHDFPGSVCTMNTLHSAKKLESPKICYLTAAGRNGDGRVLFVALDKISQKPRCGTNKNMICIEQ